MTNTASRRAPTSAGSNTPAKLGLQYSKARIYSPTLGRFLQTDPIDYWDSPNLYGYVLGDPINLLDPFGLETCSDAQDQNKKPKSGKTDEGGGPSKGCSQTDQPIDPGSIVITAVKRGTLGGVKFNFDLPYPQEQAWVIYAGGRVIFVAT